MSDIVNTKTKQLMFFKLSVQYLHFVEAVIDELLKQGNKQVIISDYQITEDEFFEKTKWSDYNIIEPLLFNFYHGVELLLKGYLKSINIATFEYSHNIENLFSSFKNNLTNHSFTSEILKKYIGFRDYLVEPLKTFFFENNITVCQYYEALRYPTDKKDTHVFDYDSLKRLGDKNLEFLSKLKADIDILRREAVKYWRSSLT